MLLILEQYWRKIKMMWNKDNRLEFLEIFFDIIPLKSGFFCIENYDAQLTEEYKRLETEKIKNNRNHVHVIGFFLKDVNLLDGRFLPAKKKIKLHIPRSFQKKWDECLNKHTSTLDNDDCLVEIIRVKCKKGKTIRAWYFKSIKPPHVEE